MSQTSKIGGNNIPSAAQRISIPRARARFHVTAKYDQIKIPKPMNEAMKIPT